MAVRGGNSKRSQRWSDDDDLLLKKLVAKNTPQALIAAKLRRSMTAIQARYYVLGMSTGKPLGRPPKKG